MRVHEQYFTRYGRKNETSGPFVMDNTPQHVVMIKVTV